LSDNPNAEENKMSAAMLSTIQPTDDIIIRNPATGEEVGRVPNMTAEEVRKKVERARQAQTDWAKLSFDERAEFVMRARKAILERLDEIALLISSEMGKPFGEAISTEIAPSLDSMQYFARNAKKLLKPEKIGIGLFGLMGRSSRIVYKPLGVVGIISPWNYPWAIPMGEVVPALMAGNTVVLKPSEITPLTGLKIEEVFRKAGLPENVLQIVTGDGKTGSALVESGVNKIMFTGSVATGKRIAETAAKTLTPVVLELGGKDPMIVCEDADIETASQAAVWGAFMNSGQTCASVERCYVHEKIAPQFIEKIVEQVKKLEQGIGTSEDVEIGSMSSERQLQIVEDHVNDAVANGAKALTGGKRNANFKGAFYEPTVLTNVNHSMRAVCEETFGPTLPIMTFKTDDEAIRLANDSEFGLNAYVWTSDINRGKKIAEQIEAGTVMVNEVIYTHGIAQTPWGGFKNSGFGRTHGKLGLLELVAPQHIHVNRFGFISDLWWFDYDSKTVELFRNFARYFATGSLIQTARILPQMISRIRSRRKS
jgi:succinate-semialdehyde dehydrogenase/glutarate-semialdehyde dehydrogenase